LDTHRITCHNVVFHPRLKFDHAEFLPVTFHSLIFEKGVYYNRKSIMVTREMYLVRRLSLILPVVFFIGGFSAMAQEQAKKSWIEAVKDSTVAIGSIRKARIQTPKGEIEKDIFAVVGTGVIMVAPEQKEGVPWLVTAKHVVYDPIRKWDPDSLQIRFNWFDQRPVDDYLGITIKLKEDNKHLWLAHQDSSVDLVAFPLVISITDAGRPSLNPVPIQTYASSSDLYEGATILAFGYPGAVGPSYWTKAVLRTGIVAWINPEKPLSSTFLVDSLVYPGNSGGPVFKVPTGVDQYGNLNVGGKIAFLGIISEGRKEFNPLYAGGKAIEMQGPTGPVVLLSEQWVGIGVVEPAERVKELLTYAYVTVGKRK
jgi:hypothetical protein